MATQGVVERQRPYTVSTSINRRDMASAADLGVIRRATRLSSRKVPPTPKQGVNHLNWRHVAQVGTRCRKVSHVTSEIPSKTYGLVVDCGTFKRPSRYLVLTRRA